MVIIQYHIHNYRYINILKYYSIVYTYSVLVRPLISFVRNERCNWLVQLLIYILNTRFTFIILHIFFYHLTNMYYIYLLMFIFHLMIDEYVSLEILKFTEWVSIKTYYKTAYPNSSNFNIMVIIFFYAVNYPLVCNRMVVKT